MKVAILWQFLFQYRIPFYKQLGQIPAIELTVFHGGVRPSAEEGVANSCWRNSFRAIRIKTTIKPLLGAVLYFQTGMWGHLIREKYDIIICEGNFGMITNFPLLIYGRLRGVPVLFWTAGWERGRVKGLPALLRKAFIKMATHLPNGYLCYSTSARDFLLRFGVKPSRCTIVQNTIDIEAIAQNYEECLKDGEQEKGRLGLTGKTIILTVGELRASKRIDVLLEAFKRIRSTRDDLSLVVIGDGPEKDRLVKNTVEERIPDVLFLGSVFAGIGRYFAMSDLFVLPGEGGLAINEAMAHGLPVICSTADGTEKDLVIEGRTGCFFKNGNADDLAFCMEKLISSPEGLRIMGRAARKHVYGIASLQKAAQEFARVLKQQKGGSYHKMENFYLNPLRSFLRRVGVLGIIKLILHIPFYGRYLEYWIKRPSRVQVQAGGIYVWMNTADSIEYAFIMNVRQDRRLLQEILDRLQPGDACWDVGANMGLYSLLFAKKVGEQGRVVSFEPEEKAFRRLLENISLNQLSHVTALNLALGRKGGQMKLQISQHHAFGTNSLVLGSQNPAGVPGCIVEVRAGDELRKEKELCVPSAIKLDVEGAEEEVLAGLNETLQNPVCRTVACEVHFSVLESKGLGGAPRRIIRQLEVCGFNTIKWLDPSHFVACKN